MANGSMPKGAARLMAGAFAGSGALLLIYIGEIPAGVGLLASMVGFFVGDANGRKNSRESSSP